MSIFCVSKFKCEYIISKNNLGDSDFLIACVSSFGTEFWTAWQVFSWNLILIY